MLIPRTYQTEAVDAAWERLCNEPGNPVIVLPTGAGKSLCIAMLCRDAVEKYGGRVFVLAHRKELLQQNADKIRALLPDLDIGVYSAGLNSRDTHQTVILGGIQSVFDKADLFGQRQLIVQDEVHLVPPDGDGMYQTFINDMRQITPKARIVGLTATPYRTGQGSICRPNAVFQRVCYEAAIGRLIEDGFLSRLTTDPTVSNFDTSGLHIRGGEFINSEMMALFDDKKKVDAACQEIVEKTKDRRSILVFCAGVFHATAVARRLEELSGEECGLVTAETSGLERAATLARFKSGSMRWCANVDVLTTGFDSPRIDAIAVLRATASPGLFAQICGRGLRVHPGKETCLILDFGSNILRHGPIDSPTFGKVSSQTRGDGDGPTKTCPACGDPCALGIRICPCGWKFPEPKLNHEGSTTDGQVLSADVEPTRWEVERVMMSRHKKKKAEPGAPDTLRVDYVCNEMEAAPKEWECKSCGTKTTDPKVRDISSGMHKKEAVCSACGSHLQWVKASGNLTSKTISEWVCLEHPTGFARNKASAWWAVRCNAPMPDIDGAIDLFGRGALATPRFILTKPDGKFLRIQSYDLDERPETWSDPSEEILDSFDEQEVPF